MTDTRQNIKELKEALPRMKEKVIAIAVMLAISFTMIASVSYAWYTMSINPEVKGINTQVSSNGSLEVALAGRYDGNGNLLPPADSSVGDSFSSKNVVEANKTWGNLINLSNYYGIENLVLRPATWDETSDAFISSKIYSEDGRVETSTTLFGFTQWGFKDEDAQTYGFVYRDSKYHGVRAISSLTYAGNTDEMEIKLSNIGARRQNIVTSYTTILSNTTYIDTIQDIVQTYLDANIDNVLNNTPMGTVDCTAYIENLYLMMNDFYTNCICQYGDLLAYMATVQTGITYTRETLSQVNLDTVELSALEDTTLNYFILEGNIAHAVKEIENLTREDVVVWDDVESIVFALIGLGDVTNPDDPKAITIAGKNMGWVQKAGLGDLASYVLGLPESKSGKTVPVIMNSGYFWEFERMVGSAYMDVKFDIKIAATIYGIPYNKACTAELTTSAKNAGTAVFVQDYNSTKEKGGTVQSSVKVAAQTYGMVIDLWVRTNAANSILTLDGLAKYTTVEVDRYVQVVEYDENGKSTTVSKQVYYYEQSSTDANGETVKTEYLVYEAKDSEGNTIYKNVTTHAVAYKTQVVDGEITSVLVTSSDVSKKTDTRIEVDGFQSSSRVDGTSGNLSYDGMLGEGELSTIQGSGSCYIFYADNPESAEATLKMLSFLRLVFVDADKQKLADARLDVDFVYAENGKYTVPIVITESGCSYEAKDSNGVPTTYYGITELAQNVATQISVVVYLEGAGVENSMVMSGENVTGNLNIQFGSTEDLDALFNTDLATKYLTLDAFLNTNLKEVSFDYNKSGHDVELSAVISGTNVSSVEAVFLRKINATQGSAMAKVTLSDEDRDGVWTATATFTLPGEYVLNGLWVDGVEFELPKSDSNKAPLTVKVNGFAVDKITLHGTGLVYTAASSVTRDVSVEFGADPELQPSSVSARFLSDKGEYVTVPMSRSGASWRGSAKFTSSGTYTLAYLVLDGEYYELTNEEHKKQFVANLGLYAEVSLVYDPVEEEGQEDTGLQVINRGKINFIYENPVRMGVQVNVYTDDGQMIEGLQGLTMSYAHEDYIGLEWGMNADVLTWNGSYYTGECVVQRAGNYYFANVGVSIGNGERETITVARRAPSVHASYKEPPAYVEDSGLMDENVIAGNTISGGIITDSVAYYYAPIERGPGLENTAVIFADASGTQYLVSPTKISDGGTYHFAFPKDDESGQNGTWTVVGFEFYNVYKDGFKYTEDNPYRVILETPESYRVIQDMDIADIGSQTLNGTFMQEFTGADLTGITVKPMVPNVALQPGDIESIKLELSYIEGTATSYTINSTTDDGALTLESYKLLSFELVEGEDGVWRIGSGSSIYLEGNYKVTGITITMASPGLDKKVQFHMIDAEHQKTVLTVRSAKPTVTITGVSHTNSHATKITWEKQLGSRLSYTYGEKKSNEINTANNSVKAYAYAKSGSTGDATFEVPTVTFTVGGVDSSSTVSFTIPGKGSVQAVEVTRTGTGTVQADLGKVHQAYSWKSWTQITYTVDGYWGHGPQEITEITIVRNGITFKVTLDNSIKIEENPDSVDQTG